MYIIKEIEEIVPRPESNSIRAAVTIQGDKWKYIGYIAFSSGEEIELFKYKEKRIIKIKNPWKWFTEVDLYEGGNKFLISKRRYIKVGDELELFDPEGP